MNRKAHFRPCIDLHDGKVKQIVGGTLNTGRGESDLRTNFVSDRTPAYYAELYRRDRLTGGHVIRLGPGNEEAALSALRAYPGGLQLGGGVDDANAGKFLSAGAEKIIVTSFVFSGGEFHLGNMRRLLSAAGRERIVLDLSCRKCADGAYRVVTDRWRNFTDMVISGDTLGRLSEYCSEFLVHAVDVEGKCAGIDRELLELLAGASPLTCVYAGGISSFADIEAIEDSGNGRIDYTIGSALDIFGGKLSYREVADRGRGD